MAPTRLQVALAIALVRSKPPAITVRDYILQLRAHLGSGRGPVAGHGAHRHLDAIAYFKRRLEEAEQRCRELERRTIQLERANDTLHTPGDVEPAAGNETGPPKRKGAGTKPAKPSKRAKPSTPHLDPSVMDARGTLGGDLEILDDAGEDGMSLALPSGADERAKEGEELAHKLYVVHMLYEKQPTNREAICFGLVETVRAISSVISAVPERYDEPSVGNRRAASAAKTKARLPQDINASARAFTSVLFGLAKVVATSEWRFPSFVIYECVSMFKAVIDSISEAARIYTNTFLAAQAKTKGKIDNARAKLATPTKESGSSTALARFFTSLISYLKKTHPHEREIFEGMFCVLLERVGKVLFYCTFGRHRSATIAGDTALQPPPTEEDEAEAAALRMEARTLIPILKRAMELAPHHMNNPPSSGSATTRNQKTSNVARTPSMKSSAPLTSWAKDRLQRTLIQAMFGEEDRDEFWDALRMPAKLGPMPSLAKVEGKDVGDWFNGEVWKLVGWDLLTQEIEW